VATLVKLEQYLSLYVPDYVLFFSLLVLHFVSLYKLCTVHKLKYSGVVLYLEYL